MTASCPRDAWAAARGRSRPYRVCQSKGFFSFGHMRGWWKPGRTLMGSGSEEDCWRNATTPGQSECGLSEAFGGPQAGQGKGGARG